MRNIMLRTASTGEIMLLVQFCITTDEEQQAALDVMAHLHATFPEITSLLYVNNTKCNDTIGDLDVVTYAGTDSFTNRWRVCASKWGRRVSTNQQRAGLRTV